VHLLKRDTPGDTPCFSSRRFAPLRLSLRTLLQRFNCSLTILRRGYAPGLTAACRRGCQVIDHVQGGMVYGERKKTHLNPRI
jgi:hypothetical protein